TWADRAYDGVTTVRETVRRTTLSGTDAEIIPVRRAEPTQGSEAFTSDSTLLVHEGTRASQSMRSVSLSTGRETALAPQAFPPAIDGTGNFIRRRSVTAAKNGAAGTTTFE